MTIWHWLVIVLLGAVVGGGFLHLRRRSKEADDLLQVRGWLALLVIGMMLLGPLMGAGRINSDLISVEAQYPALLSVAAWSTYKTAVWLTFGMGAAFMIYAGSRLAYTRNRSAVGLGIAALWIAGPLVNVLHAFVIPAFIFETSQIDSQTTGAILSSVLAAAIWTAYLLMSKRVKARYIEAAGSAPRITAASP